MANLLLLTGTAPGEPGVGGLILADLLRDYPAEKLACAVLAPRGAGLAPAPLRFPVMHIPRRCESAVRPIGGWAGEFIAAAVFALWRPRFVRAAAKRITAWSRTRGVNQILVVLESPSAIQVARRLAQMLPVPMVSIVWDDPDLFCRQFSHGGFARRRICRDFAAVLRRSTRVGVIGEAMRDEYRCRYGIECLILRHGLAPGLFQAPRPGFASREGLRIGFAGSVTALDCMKSLVSTLDELGWRWRGREITLRLIGARYLLDSRRPQRIEFLGWRPIEETVALLADCDFCYLPQTFEPSSRIFSSLSFPTKLSTYLAAGRLILLHAPEHASLAAFQRKFPAGIHCDSLCPSAVEAAIHAAGLALQDEQTEWIVALQGALGELNSENFHRAFRLLLGIDDAASMKDGRRQDN